MICRAAARPREMENAEYIARHDAYTTAIAQALSQRGGASLLEAGVGRSARRCAM